MKRALAMAMFTLVPFAAGGCMVEPVGVGPAAVVERPGNPCPPGHGEWKGDHWDCGRGEERREERHEEHEEHEHGHGHPDR